MTLKLIRVFLRSASFGTSFRPRNRGAGGACADPDRYGHRHRHRGCFRAGTGVRQRGTGRSRRDDGRRQYPQPGHDDVPISHGDRAEAHAGRRGSQAPTAAADHRSIEVLLPSRSALRPDDQARKNAGRLVFVRPSETAAGKSFAGRPRTADEHRPAVGNTRGRGGPGAFDRPVGIEYRVRHRSRAERVCREGSCRCHRQGRRPESCPQ